MVPGTEAALHFSGLHLPGTIGDKRRDGSQLKKKSGHPLA